MDRGGSERHWDGERPTSSAAILVRLEMDRIADEVGVEPIRISFVAALRLVCDAFDSCAITQTPGEIPNRLAAMRAKLKRFILPSRRLRLNPRAVKLKMSN